MKRKYGDSMAPSAGQSLLVQLFNSLFNFGISICVHWSIIVIYLWSGFCPELLFAGFNHVCCSHLPAAIVYFVNVPPC